jgi:hypothetical protein
MFSPEWGQKIKETRRGLASSVRITIHRRSPGTEVSFTLRGLIFNTRKYFKKFLFHPSFLRIPVRKAFLESGNLRAA